MKGLVSIGAISEPIKGFGSHKHSSWEIVYYTYGEGSIHVGEKEILFSPKVIVCLPPDIPHWEVSVAGYKNYHFTVHTFKDLGMEIPHFKDNENGDFLNILTQMYKEYHLKQNNWKGIADTLLEVLYQYMISWTYGHKKNPWVEKFEGVLVSNISNMHFSIEKALLDIPLSPDHFRKIFKSETGKSPIQYLVDKRISYAKQLLEMRQVNRHKIKEISFLCGIDDPYYFSRVFKKMTGMAPEDWRGQGTDE